MLAFTFHSERGGGILFYNTIIPESLFFMPCADFDLRRNVVFVVGIL